MRVGSVWACAVACAAAAVVVGCGPEPAKDTRPDIYVRGKLMDGNKPWVLEEKKTTLPPGVGQPPGVPGAPGGGAIQMAFLSVEGSDVVYGQVDASAGTFTAKGLKAGRYKIALYGGSNLPGAGDPFKGQFTQDKTKIVRELKNGDDITIDVSKPTG